MIKGAKCLTGCLVSDERDIVNKITSIHYSLITDTAQTILVGYANHTIVARTFVGALREQEAGVVRFDITVWSIESERRAVGGVQTELRAFLPGCHNGCVEQVLVTLAFLTVLETGDALIGCCKVEDQPEEEDHPAPSMGREILFCYLFKLYSVLSRKCYPHEYKQLKVKSIIPKASIWNEPFGVTGVLSQCSIFRERQEKTSPQAKRHELSLQVIFKTRT